MMTEFNQISNKKHSEDMTQIVEENTKLAKENQSLRQNIADLNGEVDCQTWKSFHRSDKSNHVVVGNNIIRDISVDKMEDTKVRRKIQRLYILLCKKMVAYLI